MPELNTTYTQIGIDAEKYMEETERLAIAQYQENGLTAEQYMEETGRAASIVCHE